VAHANARTTIRTRTEIGMLRASGLSLRQIAVLFGTSAPTVSKWAKRFAAGESLQDRSSRPRRMPRLTAPEVAKIVLEARRESGLGPAMLQGYLGIAASTIHKILHRAGVSRPPRPEREPANRYERDRPGELVHVDVKKLGRIGARVSDFLCERRRCQSMVGSRSSKWILRAW